MGKTGRTNNKYSPEFKKDAVERYLSGEPGSLASAIRKLFIIAGVKAPAEVRVLPSVMNVRLFNDDKTAVIKIDRFLFHISIKKDSSEILTMMISPVSNC